MRLCWPQWIFIIVVIFLGIGSMLTGCGQKGPLFLPEAEQDNIAQTAESEDENNPDSENKQKKNKSN